MSEILVIENCQLFRKFARILELINDLYTYVITLCIAEITNTAEPHLSGQHGTKWCP